MGSFKSTSTAAEAPSLELLHLILTSGRGDLRLETLCNFSTNLHCCLIIYNISCIANGSFLYCNTRKGDYIWVPSAYLCPDLSLLMEGLGLWFSAFVFAGSTSLASSCQLKYHTVETDNSLEVCKLRWNIDLIGLVNCQKVRFVRLCAQYEEAYNTIQIVRLACSLRHTSPRGNPF